MAQLVKNPPATWEIWVQSLGWEDPLEKGIATPLQYSGLENSMDCIVHRVAKNRTQLGNFHFHISLLKKLARLQTGSTNPPRLHLHHIILSADLSMHTT